MQFAFGIILFAICIGFSIGFPSTPDQHEFEDGKEETLPILQLSDLENREKSVKILMEYGYNADTAEILYKVLTDEHVNPNKEKYLDAILTLSYPGRLVNLLNSWKLHEERKGEALKLGLLLGAVAK